MDENDRKVLEDGISGSVLRMHRRDFLKAATAATAYLGDDREARRSATVDALLPAEAKAARAAAGQGDGLELYGQPTVTIALSVVARENFPDFDPRDAQDILMRDPTLIDRTEERFRGFSAERIMRSLG